MILGAANYPDYPLWERNVWAIVMSLMAVIPCMIMELFYSIKLIIFLLLVMFIPVLLTKNNESGGDKKERERAKNEILYAKQDEMNQKCYEYSQIVIREQARGLYRPRTISAAIVNKTRIDPCNYYYAGESDIPAVPSSLLKFENGKYPVTKKDWSKIQLMWWSYTNGTLEDTIMYKYADFANYYKSQVSSPSNSE